MCFVHDHEIPVDLAQPREDVGALREVERSNDPAALEPLIHAELIADIAAFNNQEFLVEFFF